MPTNITNMGLSILEIRNGENWRKAFVNTASGRAELQDEYPEVYAEVCGESKPWGTEPTVILPVPQEIVPGQTEPLEQRVTNCETDIEQIVTGLEALANG